MTINDPGAGSNRQKVIEFIPYKTMVMDLESILANLTRIYVNRGSTEMVEIVSMSQAELFPIGSFDPEAEKYEYVLKLAVPAKFHIHLRDNIRTIQPQLCRDLATVTAAYIHESISNVFVVMKIDQDASWREAAMEWVATRPDADKQKEFRLFLCHAGAEESPVVREMKSVFLRKGISVCTRTIASVKERDLQHLLTDFERTADLGVVIVSAALTGMPFPDESIELLTSYVNNPGRRFCQIWDAICRADVATFSPGLAGSLAYTTERMSVEHICGLLLAMAGVEE